MATDLFRSVNLKNLTPDVAAWFQREVAGDDWKRWVGRRLKARKLPWRAEDSVRGLHFKGRGLWPSQRKYIADRMRSIITDTLKRGKASAWYVNRHDAKRVKDLRRWIKEKNKRYSQSARKRDRRRSLIQRLAGF